MKTSDIAGAHSGTIHAVTYKDQCRHVNPLDPEYNYPGSKEIEA
jgi:hypothetical protein